MSKDIHITDNSEIKIVRDSQIFLDDRSKVEVRGTDDYPFYVRKLQNIAPIAAHIKEVNHIDPLTVEAVNVTQVRNIEPFQITKFNVTNLPLVNMYLRQLPPVDFNIRRLPALSIGTHQVFEMPSDYTLRARVLGFEVLRVNLTGHTRIAPAERFRREQERVPERSYPVVATAGNPAIPSIHKEGPRWLSCGVAGSGHPVPNVSHGRPVSGLRVSGSGPGIGG